MGIKSSGSPGPAGAAGPPGPPGPQGAFKATTARLATTGNDSLTGLAARDGVIPVAGDRILAWQQTNPIDNGIYNAAAGAWTRSSDWNVVGNALAGSMVIVTEGDDCSDASEGGALFQCVTKGLITPGVTAVTFERVSAGRFWAEGLTGTNAGVNILQTRIPGTTHRLIGFPSGGNNEFTFGDAAHGKTNLEGSAASLTDDANSQRGFVDATSQDVTLNSGAQPAAKFQYAITEELADPTEQRLGKFDNILATPPFGGMYAGARAGPDDTQGGTLRFRGGLGRGAGAPSYAEFGGAIKGAPLGPLQTDGFSARAYAQFFAGIAGFASNRTPVNDAAFLARVTDHQIAYTALTAARVVSGPVTADVPAGVFLEFILIDESGNANASKTIAFTPNSGTIDGVASKVLVNTPLGAARVYFDGVNWHSSAVAGLATSILTDPVFYVDPVSGNDANAGTIGSPFATLNHALQLLAPGWYGLATINLRAGTNTIANKTVIPAPLGNSTASTGGLLLNGVDNTADPIGNRTANGGTAGSQATFGTVVDSVGGLTINAHRGKFLRFTSGATLNGRVYLIEGNTATTFTVEGAITIAPTTETFVVETPAAVVSWPGTQNLMGDGSLLGLQNVVMNGPGGSNLITFSRLVMGVQKVQFTNIGSFGITVGEHASLVNLTAIAAQLGATVVTGSQQCGAYFNFNAQISLVSTARVSVSRCLFQDAHLEMFQIGVYQATDSTFRGNAYVRAVFGGLVSLDRFHMDTVTPAPALVPSPFIAATGAAIVISKGATGTILHGDISNTPATTGPGDAILVEDKSECQLSNLTGSGNAGVGCRVNRFSSVVEDKSSSTLTLTGTLGDVKAGQNPVGSWPVSASNTDLIELCVVTGT